ncbi:SMI1/KNR4 family protein [Hymenobacter cellulosilyticus]|uniref:SMI1/KNR4 family protein n=1 Tax=Hymenobacter cellulosilyticus TaxID=2932248 RepID=A0A8T9QDQ5_9BACT|nr:SMI1/KNR4 family protein [Hymenobacter cellulosilyticus]
MPEELRLWLGWHNGQQGFESFVENNCLQSLGSAAETMRINRQLLEAGEFELANWWQPGWVPILENGGGDHVCVDLQGSFTGRAGQLLEHWHDWEPRNVLFPNLTSWLQAVVQTYEEAGENGTELTDEDLVATELKYPAGFPQEFAAGS